MIFCRREREVCRSVGAPSIITRLTPILRTALFLLAYAGSAGSVPADNPAQIKLWRSEGRLAAGPWKESVLYGARRSNVELLWVRHDPRGGLVALIPVDDAVKSTLGAKAASDQNFAERVAVRPWTQISDTARSRLPAGCFFLSRSGQGLVVTTAADQRTFPASHFKMLPEGRVLLYGAPFGTRGLHSGAQAVVLDSRGAVAASAGIPAGSSGRFDFVGPFLVSVQVAGTNAITGVLDPQTLVPMLPDQPFALVLDTSAGAARDFSLLVLRDAAAPGEAAKLIIAETGPVELPFAWDRLRPFQRRGDHLIPVTGAGGIWQVEAWLAEREGEVVAVLDKQGRLLAGGLKSADPVSITGFVHAVGAPGSVPGFVACNVRGEWRVVWLDGVEPSPPMAQRDWALGGARSQRGGLNVQSINDNNRRAIAATQAALAQEASRRAEAARLQAIAESKAKEYAAMLDTIEGLIGQKQPRQALAVIDRLDRRAMHHIHPQRWERACLVGAKQALEGQDEGTWIAFRGLLASFPIQRGSEADLTLAAVDAKIAAMSRKRHAQTAAAAAASGSAAGPSNYVRELPGDAMRAMYGAMRREMESAGANYYGR